MNFDSDKFIKHSRQASMLEIPVGVDAIVLNPKAVWMGWGGRLEGASGWVTHVHPWLIHVMQTPLWYCKVIGLQLKWINILKQTNKTQGSLKSRISSFSGDFSFFLIWPSIDWMWPDHNMEKTLLQNKDTHTHIHSLTHSLILWLCVFGNPG